MIMSATLHTCPDCGASFQTECMRQRHQTFKHSPSAYFPLPGGRKVTISRIDGQLHCPLCDASYICANTLHCHLRLNHGGDNGLTCWQCGQQFDSKNSVKQHVRITHQATTPVVFMGQEISVVRKNDVFHCPGCDSAYRNTESLRHHVRVTHLQDREPTASETLEKNSKREYACEKCQEWFKTKAEYDQHFRNIHQHRVVIRNVNPKPIIVERVGAIFPCPRCNQDLQTRNTLQSHLKGICYDQPMPGTIQIADTAIECEQTAKTSRRESKITGGSVDGNTLRHRINKDANPCVIDRAPCGVVARKNSKRTGHTGSRQSLRTAKKLSTRTRAQPCSKTQPAKSLIVRLKLPAEYFRQHGRVLGQIQSVGTHVHDAGQAPNEITALPTLDGDNCQAKQVDAAFKEIEEQCIRVLSTLRRLQRPHPKAIVRLLEAVRDTKTRVGK